MPGTSPIEKIQIFSTRVKILLKIVMPYILAASRCPSAKSHNLEECSAIGGHK
jgi:hypothetical protein